MAGRRNSIGIDAPPERGVRSSGKNMAGSKDQNELVPISHKVPRKQSVYLKKLSIETDREIRDLLSEAITLLEEKYGDV